MKTSSRSHPDPKRLWPMLLVAIAMPALLPGAPGATISMVALSTALLMYVRARALRGWWVAALAAALLVAAVSG